MIKPRAMAIIHGALEGAGERVRLEPVVVQPLDVSVERNDYRTADACQMTLSWPRFPVDPRQFAAAGLDVYLGPAGADGRLSLGAETIAFSGHVDRLEQMAGGDGVTMKVEARDFTALFLDCRWGKTVPLSTLQATLQSIVDEVPGASGMAVELLDIPDLQLKAARGRTRYTPPPDSDAWTVMTNICRRVGAVLYVELQRVIVAGPRTLFPDTQAPTLIWGRDLHRVEVIQELKAEARRGVLLTSWDPDTGEAVEARYPATSPRLVVDNKRRKATPSETYLEWFVAGVPTAQALNVARRVWEAQARGQGRVRIETSRLMAIDDDSALYKLKHSDPVAVIAPARSRRGLPDVPEADMLAYLQGPRIGMDEGSARAFSQAREALVARDLPFYTRRARHRWSAEGGYQLTADLSTYVIAGGGA